MKGKLHSLILYLIVGPFAGSFHILPIMLFTSRYYHFGWWSNQSKNTTAFGAVFYLCASFCYVGMAKFPLFPRWLKYVVTPLCMFAVTIILGKAEILHNLVWWDPWYYIIFSIIALGFTESMSKCIAKGI